MQQQQANNQEQELQEQENDFGLAVATPWEMTQGTYHESVALLTQAFCVEGLQSEESLHRLAFWLVRSKAGLSIAGHWNEWDYNDLNTRGGVGRTIMCSGSMSTTPIFGAS